MHYYSIIIHIADDLVAHVDYAEHRSGHDLPRRGRRSPRGLRRHRLIIVDLHIKSINWYAVISPNDYFYLSLGIPAQSFL